MFILLLFSMFFLIRVPRKSIITIMFFFRTLIVERGRGKVNKRKRNEETN